MRLTGFTKGFLSGVLIGALATSWLLGESLLQLIK